MSPERWRQVRRLFEQASDMAVAERAEFLTRACGEDPALRQEVDAFLAAEQAAGGLLEGAGLPSLSSPAPDPDLARQQLGAYRLEEKIGQGGMSVVYRASRADDAYRQRVAIKVQRQGLGSEHLVRRFRRERQILAQLEHPHIARLLDGGTTEDGRPFVVMEYVEGLAIDEYCDRHRCSIDQRLELFRTVCGAVQYAHQNLIVHRDLKPGNILVTADGTPKLLDFGIAKLLGPEVGTEGPETTVAWLRLMTPSFASPEQARGGVITTASDVYSLGVLLYRLLSGRAPYRLEGRSAAEVERVLQTVEPTRVSEAINRATSDAEAPTTDPRRETPPEAIGAARGRRPEALRRRLQGDLDTIVARAMHKAPERRYTTAEGLAEDLRRHLVGLPVLARRDRFTYRAGKFLRRHLVEAAAVSIIFGLIVAFALTTRAQSMAVARERDQVRAERDKNAEVLQFLTDIFETSSPEKAKGETITAREILDRGAQRIDEQLKDRPDTHATLLLTMGNVNYNLGRYEVAEAQLRRAVAIRRQLPAEAPLALAEGLFYLGRALLESLTLEAAEQAFGESVEVSRGIPESRYYLVESLQGLAEVSRVAGDYDASEALFREALAIEESASGGESLSFTEALAGLARTLLHRGEFAEAQALSEQALANKRRLLDPGDPRLAISLVRLSEVLFFQEDLAGAESAAAEALALHEKNLGPSHPDVAYSLDSLAQIVLARGDSDRAVGLFRRAEAINRAVFGDDDPRLAVALNNLGKGLRQSGDLEGAEAATREALEIYRRLGEHPNLASSLFNVGRVLQTRGKRGEAAALYREALDVQRRSGAPQHLLAHPLVRLGNLLREDGSPAEAEPLLREALRVRRDGLPQGHRLTALAAGYLGVALSALQQYDEAEPLLLEAHAAFTQSEASDPATAEIWRGGLEALYLALGRRQEAARYAVAPAPVTTP
ncbi:MAG: tetratricopeptide repeat protein [Acidobacteriota bacterium]